MLYYRFPAWFIITAPQFHSIEVKNPTCFQVYLELFTNPESNIVGKQIAGSSDLNWRIQHFFSAYRIEKVDHVCSCSIINATFYFSFFDWFATSIEKLVAGWVNRNRSFGAIYNNTSAATVSFITGTAFTIPFNYLSTPPIVTVAAPAVIFRIKSLLFSIIQFIIQSSIH